MKKKLTTFVKFIFIFIGFQNALSQTFTVPFNNVDEFLKEQTNRALTITNSSQECILTVTGIPLKDTSNFLKYSGIRTSQNFIPFSITAKKFQKTDTTGLKKWMNSFNKGIYEINISKFFDDNDMPVYLYLATDINDTAKRRIVIKKPENNTGDTVKPKNVGKSQNDVNSNISRGSFIPNDSLEAKWTTTYYSNIITPPLLNKHTKWAITYDYTQQDPVAIWRRTNKVAGTTCESNSLNSLQSFSYNNSKIKKPNKINNSISEIVNLIYKIDTTLMAVKNNAINNYVTSRLTEIQKKSDDLKREVKPSISPEELRAINDKAIKLYMEIDIVKGFYPGIFTTINRNTAPIISSTCCDKIYCVKQVERLAPTVARDLLVSVTNYHPYKDSFSLAISYDDRFLENGTLFTSTFTSLLGTSPTNPTSKDSTEKTKNIVQDGNNDKQAKVTILNLFEYLRDDLKAYYTSKYEQANLDVRTVENGVVYIKSRMTSILGITDFSEAGIVKRGEELADSLKKQVSNVSLNEYFGVVRETAIWFTKVANYKRFDSKSILVQNKDVMNITLNRYRDGKLMTITNEGLRSYHTEGGFKIDFSVGLFGSNLLDQLYTTKSVQTYDTSFFTAPNGVVNRDSIVDIDTAQRKQIIRDRQGKFDLGPAVFLHGYWRTGWDINISGTFGLSINQSANLRYLYGLSLLIGKDSRWVVSIGGIAGKVKELSSSYQENQIINPLTENNGTIPTKDVTKSGWFASVSWNFGGFTLGSNH